MCGCGCVSHGLLQSLLIHTHTLTHTHTRVVAEPLNTHTHTHSLSLSLSHTQVIDLSSNLLTADGIWVIAEPLKENESLEVSQNVLSIVMHIDVFSIECVLYIMCSLQK
jgi:hypothetical protein